ncbi:glutathione peroxidase [Massilia forsythiae]|uniref:Glutathione peroxidase n=2 Tax=Massilia forsythiae TaxID=2728020 RepID=A0A7Z2ZRN4_9BURK|nr:glutathione peroxidase [Massilia forsythiae]
MNVFNFQATSLAGKPVKLAEYRGKVLLILNTASKCGFATQYEALEELYHRFKNRGLEILGFPCNQFASQEPGSAAEIGAFCERNYGISFPMFAKIDVNGDHAHPLWKHLKAEAPGFLGTESIKWNFTKFLVGRDGKVIRRYAPRTRPDNMIVEIEKALAQ